ncbi:MAG: indole-3-glycerol phosphate synthase [Herbinix sp.]|jgi:indole-3-glycerol phosphate synthase|nr:indole-3-glycerol phosphate synthase [Herbinix sp.]
MILDILADSSKKRVEKAKENKSLEELKELIYLGGIPRSFNHRPTYAFEDALRKRRSKRPNKITEDTMKLESKTAGEVKDKIISDFDGNDIALICEVKKASPSKGVIAEHFPYLSIAKEYEEAGASAISVLTEPDYFQGSDQYLKEISEQVSIPVLRKDFTIDEYQIYESKYLGADAVLLICAILPTDTLQRFIKLCDSLGLSALVEVHTEEEIASALQAGASIIGVNNRNLQTFDVDIQNCIRLRDMVPDQVIYIAESGIQSLQDIELVKKANIDAVLIGEALMRSNLKREMIALLRGDRYD